MDLLLHGLSDYVVHKVHFTGEFGVLRESLISFSLHLDQPFRSCLEHLVPCSLFIQGRHQLLVFPQKEAECVFEILVTVLEYLIVL